MGTGPFLIRSQPFPAVPASRDARRSQSRARHCKTKALGGSSNPAPPNRHCSLNENSVPKVHSAPKLCHPSVTWCCHLHSDPLPLEQRAGLARNSSVLLQWQRGQEGQEPPAAAGTVYPKWPSDTFLGCFVILGTSWIVLQPTVFPTQA